MKYDDSHLSDEQILLSLDSELPAQEASLVSSHLNICWKCRTRRRELEGAIGDFVHAYHQDLSSMIPPADGPRALLKAQLDQLYGKKPGFAAAWTTWHLRSGWPRVPAILGAVAVGLLVILAGLNLRHPTLAHAAVVSIPDSTLTPGAAVLVDRQAVCAQANLKNRPVPAALQRIVFEEYGISNSAPGSYEVDYLVTPALGGADDIHNLWPHSYGSTVWNARVKDALEDRLREMVCDGNVDLHEAQREIAQNWIAAYQKYFHTDQPLPAHQR